ncbi:hypothetical protein ACFYUJ_24275 [Streptomyces sp. NPDC004520]
MERTLRVLWAGLTGMVRHVAVRMVLGFLVAMFFVYVVYDK